MPQNAITQWMSESFSVDRRRYLEVCVAAAEEADQGKGQKVALPKKECRGKDHAGIEHCPAPDAVF
jgi:hypothetical protein